MKCSNIIFISLIAGLTILPAAIAGYFYLFPKEITLTGLKEKHTVFAIENPNLKVENVKIEYITYDDTENFFTFNDEKLSVVNTSIYYKGKKNYIPSIREDGDTLYIGQPKKSTQNEPLTLYIKSYQMKKVILNGKVIWDNNILDIPEDGFTYIPDLTEKIQAFVQCSVSLQNELNKK